jgi:hypothetical protein
MALRNYQRHMGHLQRQKEQRAEVTKAREEERQIHPYSQHSYDGRRQQPQPPPAPPLQQQQQQPPPQQQRQQGSMGAAEWGEYKKQRKRWEALRAQSQTHGHPQYGRVVDPLSVLQLNTNGTTGATPGTAGTADQGLFKGSKGGKSGRAAAGVAGAARAASHYRRMVPALLPALSLVVRSLLPQSRPANPNAVERAERAQRLCYWMVVRWARWQQQRVLQALWRWRQVCNIHTLYLCLSVFLACTNGLFSFLR